MNHIGRPYRSYLLALLLIILSFNNVDKLALGLVLQDIKIDLHLSDSQLGALSGIAFALFYSIMGIPIARWADRSDRVVIIGITTALWSIAVALCGLAGSFLQLMLIRVAIGVGEAGCVPPAHSLISDEFPRSERPRALSMYMQGYSVSVIVGYFAAGWLNQLYGWRIMFVLVALPGIALALIACVTLREPRRTLPKMESSRTATPSLKDLCVTLARHSTFRNLLLGYSLILFFSYGALNWQPAFFVRSFHLTTSELGTWFAVSFGVLGAIGTYLGGELACHWAPNNEPLQLKAAAIVNAVFNGAMWSFIYLCHNYKIAIIWMGVSNLGGVAILGPLFAALQTLVPKHVRAMAVAVVLLFANLIGMGLGPLFVGIMSDALQPIFGTESLRYSLLAICPGYLWVSWHLWRASKTFTRDLDAMPRLFTHEVASGEVASRATS